MKLIQAASYILTRVLGLNKLMDLEIYQLQGVKLTFFF